MRKKTTKEFIINANKIHGDKYDYSVLKYSGNKNKVNIICTKHGVFIQTPTRHLNGDGCPSCNGGVLSNKEEFKKKAHKIHGDKYDYSKVNYYNSKTHVNINCLKHGKFKQAPNNHLLGQGCPKCGIEKKFLTTKEFIKKAKQIHGNTYDYSKVNYIKNTEKVKIICSIHGEFEQIAGTHIRKNGRGCPTCSESKGEKKIRVFFENNNINFEQQKTFGKCKNKRELFFDFYVPSKKLVIEFDGEQHYKPNNYFGGIKTFKYIQNNDKIKENFLKENKIDLMRIRYNDLRNNNIENILKIII